MKFRNCLCAALLSVTVASRAHAVPITAGLTTKYDSTNYELTYTLDLFPRPKPTEKCSITKIGNGIAYASAEGEALDTSFTSKRNTTLKFALATKRLKLKITGLPPVEDRESDGGEPVLSSQFQIKCTGNKGKITTLYTNTDAVFIVCGAGQRMITPTAFLKGLAAEIKAELD